MSNLWNKLLAIGKLAQLMGSSLKLRLREAPEVNMRLAGKSAVPIQTFVLNIYLEVILSIMALLPKCVYFQRR